LNHPPIDKIGSWGYFGGASQGTPRKGRARIIIHISGSHVISFKVGMRQGTNNSVELISLKTLLRLVAQHGITKFQAFGTLRLSLTR